MLESLINKVAGLCVSYRNQSFALLCKTNEWFLFETYRPITLLKRDSNADSCEYCEIFKDTIFTEHLRTTAFGYSLKCNCIWNPLTGYSVQLQSLLLFGKQQDYCSFINKHNENFHVMQNRAMCHELVSVTKFHFENWQVFE